MKKKFVLLCAGLVVVCGCIFMMGCSSGSDSSETKTGTITDFTLKNGGTVAYIDDLMSVSLDENATTGYTWTYKIADPSLITMVEEETFGAETDDDKVGVGGTRIFEFMGKGAGTTEVTFTLGQNWDGGETSDDATFVLEVTIDEAGNITKAVEK